MKFEIFYMVVMVSIINVINLACVQYKRLEKADNFKDKIKSILPETKKKLLFFCIMLFVNVSSAIYLNFFFSDLWWISLLKGLCLISLLWPVAFIDYREYRIPNKILVLGLMYRGFIIPIELIFNEGTFLNTLVSELLAVVVIFLACALLRIIIKNSIGMGDIKLFLVISLYLGLMGAINAIMVSFVVSFFISVILLVLKRKERKDAIPFGPAALAGTFISIMLTGV